MLRLSISCVVVLLLTGVATSNETTVTVQVSGELQKSRGGLIFLRQPTENVKYRRAEETGVVHPILLNAPGFSRPTLIAQPGDTTKIINTTSDQTVLSTTGRRQNWWNLELPPEAALERVVQQEEMSFAIFTGLFDRTVMLVTPSEHLRSVEVTPPNWAATFQRVPPGDHELYLYVEGRGFVKHAEMRTTVGLEPIGRGRFKVIARPGKNDLGEIRLLKR